MGKSARKKPRGRGKGLLHAKGIIRGARDPMHALSTVITAVPATDYRALAKWASAILPPAGAWQHLCPSTISSLHSGYQVQQLDLVRQLSWIEALVQVHAEKINKFLESACNFEDAMLTGDQSRAFYALEDADSVIGLSLWSMCNRFAAFQHFEGLDAQKSYVAQIRQSDASALIKSTAYYWSIRAEEATTPKRYYLAIDDMLTRSKLDDDGFRNYVDYHLRGQLPDHQTDAEMLNYSLAGSLVDSYALLLDLASDSIIEGHKNAAEYGRVVRSLATAINDPRLLKLAYLDGAGIGMIEGLPAAPTSYRDIALTGGKVCDIEDTTTLEELLAASELQNSSDEIDDNTSLADYIVNKFAAVRKAGQPGLGAAFDLLKLSLILSKTNFGEWVSVAVFPELEPSHENHRTRLLRRFVATPDIDPFVAPALPPSLRSSYLKCLDPIYGKRPTICSVTYLAVSEEMRDDCLLDQITEIKKREIKIYRSFLSRNYAEAYDGANKLLDKVGPKESKSALQIAMFSLVFMNRIEEVVQKTVKISIDHPDIRFWMPINIIIEKLDKKERSKLYDKIELPILYDIYLNNFDSDLHYLRSFSCEDFWISRGQVRPSALNNDNLDVPRDLLIYYLREVCTQEVMQLSTSFDSSRALDDERERICRMLIELDADRSNEYQEELRELVRTAHIQRTVLHLQQSKISIDIGALRSWAQKSLREDFERYKDLLSNGISVGGDKYVSDLLEALKEGRFEQSLFNIPENEASELFTDIIARFISESYTNQEHGLDCYLSMRIRHGTLSGQLRDPVEAEHLITQRDGTTREYKANIHWEQRLRDRISPALLDKIDERLRQFASDFDNLVGMVAADLIQIKGPDKPEGLFHGSITRPMLLAYASDIAPETSFDDFLDGCFTVFWSTVERDLQRVRETIDNELKTRFHQEFQTLEQDVSELAGEIHIGELRDAVRRSRTNLQLALDRVKEWFALPRPSASIMLSMEELIDIGVETVRALHREFEPRLAKKIGDLPKLQNALIIFSDIFFIVFENVRRHSGNGRDPEITVIVKFEDDKVKIRVENAVAADNMTQQALNRLSAIRSRLEQGEYIGAVPSEGGTGLLKLRKLIGDNSDGRAKLDFALSDSRFFVEFSVSAHLISETFGSDGHEALVS